MPRHGMVDIKVVGFNKHMPKAPMHVETRLILSAWIRRANSGRRNMKLLAGCSTIMNTSGRRACRISKKSTLDERQTL